MIVYTRQVKVQSRENYLNYNTNKEEVPTLAGNEHFSLHFFLHSQATSFPCFDRKSTGLIRRTWTSKRLFPHRQKTNDNETTDQTVPIIG